MDNRLPSPSRGTNASSGRRVFDGEWERGREDKKPRHPARANKRALLIKLLGGSRDRSSVAATSGRRTLLSSHIVYIWLTRASNEKILWQRGPRSVYSSIYL